MSEKNYGGESITVLEGLDAVRVRPGMYIGTTSSRGLHHLVWEIVDNSIDEALAGVCDTITVKMLPDSEIEIIDNGRGIPTDMHKSGKSTLEVVMTVLHAGGKFDNSNYQFSGGLHGVGISVVNALSEKLEATVTRDGRVVRQIFSKGNAITEALEIGKAPAKAHGTTIKFKPDADIFETIQFDYDILQRRLKELAYLNQGIKIILIDARKPEKVKEEVFYFEGGIVDFVTELVGEDKIIEDVIYMKDRVMLTEGEVDDEGNPIPDKYSEVEIAMIYKNSQSTIEYSFVNNINTSDGGTHVSGLRTALTRTINDLAREASSKNEFKGEDVREGLVYVLSLKFPEPQFESQTKAKLGSSEATSIVSGVFGSKLKMYLEDHPKDCKTIIDKIAISKQAREAAKRARDLVTKKNEFSLGGLPGKLADCQSKNPEESEIFIVEGDSAGGSAKQGRFKEYQAILPLRGKILNVEKANEHKILENSEIKAMITAFGAGFGERFDIEKLRYHKIIIMTDADVDGAHIRTLMLTFFYRYLRELINNGHIYIAQPPLYKVTTKSGKKEQVKYAYSDEQLKSITRVLDEKLGVDNSGKNKYNVQRYKGLGEMNPDQLKETTMDPDVRTLLKVTLEDAQYADKMFSILMGDKVEPRREFIEEHANYVRNLDI
ncbi:DNA topoisomerase (ATP-hydrolyzing) subunit B [Streptobacillus moniliformis]|uniref:DNA gyrase subunit B n=1 Tax=Streptobacillus moniliformis TaxID=34105 RepID=A0A0K1LZN8_9FUSO|nr:DNA topoisomerase (ATP-hydrolyzing) subunit B [Streptobacillus moniliformis]AKU48326.1 GyrB [Streptobacillus moniliformis]AKU48328.1 GyrB [Streptobacillus moniliformis]AKU48334.1 GyrB [Streptobacillus moniliformis]AKU48335.1 GyrB [Streptobacillus moniliformis]